MGQALSFIDHKTVGTVICTNRVQELGFFSSSQQKKDETMKTRRRKEDDIKNFKARERLVNNTGFSMDKIIKVICTTS